MRWLELDIPKEQFVQIGRPLDEVLVELNWAPSKTQARKTDFCGEHVPKQALDFPR